ncbi:hypothetical protein QVD17_18632 [Tagetes erecta]|uniref:EF-hand domain-containing protein n=1 Tax=Tagetes erecta TaxID=13708 RepID=A0AAD8NWL1_TARER|nr:hypothetical protein QVD17_18632 [Tagetes erecta]
MTFMILELIQYFISQKILTMSIYPHFWFYINDSKIQVLEKKNQDYSKLSKRLSSFKYISIQGHEVEMVMGKLGMLCGCEVDNLPKCLSCDELFNMFEEEQPRLDEVKEAFDVFDENKDGYIDAQELRRVFCALGFRDEVAMDDCKKMIRVFDENDDGRIDFYEFVKFMECTC